MSSTQQSSNHKLVRNTFWTLLVMTLMICAIVLVESSSDYIRSTNSPKLWSSKSLNKT
jgi:hypothetical protein